MGRNKISAEQKPQLVGNKYRSSGTNTEALASLSSHHCLLLNISSSIIMNQAHYEALTSCALDMKTFKGVRENGTPLYGFRNDLNQY